MTRLNISRKHLIEEPIPLYDMEDRTAPPQDRSSSFILNRKRLMYIATAAVAVAIIALISLTIVAIKGTSCPSSWSSDIKISANVTTPEPPTTTPNPNEPWHQKLLPNTLVPIHYDLTFYPDLYGENGTTFDGNSTITAKTTKSTRHILLHIENLNISSYAVTDSFTKKTIAIRKDFRFPKNNYWVIVSEQLIPFNTTLEIKITFNGSLTNGLLGFYKTSFFNKNEKELKNMALTEFEPSFARQAFPSFDEPQYKAFFTLHLVHKKSHTTLANTPIHSTVPSTLLHRDGDQLLLTTFRKTPVPMSTYLVCFIVTESYTSLRSTFGNHSMRIFASENKIQNAQYAAEIGSKIEAYFDQLFNYTSPWPKTDMIAIPDFEFGAMENWGLITYRETALLFNATTDTESNRKRVGEVIAHELAHMWFGNTVTMKWWNHIWLNEGFATCFGSFGLQHVEPNWDSYGMQILFGTRLKAMQFDNNINSSSVVRDVDTDIQAVFDSISYDKGGALLTWLHSIMGDRNFFSALHNYIKSNQYKNVATTDFLMFIRDWSLGQNTTQLMSSFLYQPGYPTVTVSFDNSSKKIIAKQSWFLLSPETRNDASPSPYNHTWWINMKYISSDNTAISQTVEMTYNQSRISLDSPVNMSDNPNAWILFNTDCKGYYRVNYDQSLWQRIKRQLMRNHTKLTPLQRAILLDDVFALSEAGTLAYKTAFDLASYLATEEHLYPWRVFEYRTSKIQRILKKNANFGLWQSYIQSLVTNIYLKRDSVLRDYAPNDLLPTTITSLACGNGLKICLEDTSKEFMDWVRNGTKPRIETRGLTYFYGLRENDRKKNWNKLWATYLSEDNNNEKLRLIKGLTGTRQMWLHMKLLNNLLNTKYVRLQEVRSYLRHITRTFLGKTAAWDWLNTKWPQIKNHLSYNTVELRKVVSYCIPTFESMTQTSAINKFFDNNPDANISGLQEDLLSSNKRHLLWKEVHLPKIVKWLRENQ